MADKDQSSEEFNLYHKWWFWLMVVLATAIIGTEVLPVILPLLPLGELGFWGIVGGTTFVYLMTREKRLRKVGGSKLQQELDQLKQDIADLKDSQIQDQLTETIVDVDELKHLEQTAKGIVVILFSDIEGFTQFVEHHGDEVAYDRLKLHNQIVRNALRLNNGTEVKHLGDGFMANFSSARDALLCAAEIQSQLEEFRHQDMPLQVRIGIHAGEPIQEQSDFVGRTVILAQRIMNQAKGGQTYVSDVVKTLVGPVKGFQYVDQGLRRLEGISEAQQLHEFHPIDALAAPTDSTIDRRLQSLEERLRSKEQPSES